MTEKITPYSTQILADPIPVVKEVPSLSREEILRATQWRRAVKEYDGRQIPADDWNYILEMGRLAPSSMGFEPWNLIDITNKDLLKTLDAIAWGIGDKVPGLPHLVIFTVKNNLAANSPYFRDVMKSQQLPEHVVHAKTAKAQDYQDNDQDLTDDRKRHDWAAKQTYIAFTQMMIAASLIGVDSTPIEGFPIKPVTQALVEAGALDSTADSVTLMGAFGYRAADPHHAKTRRPLNEIVTTVK